MAVQGATYLKLYETDFEENVAYYDQSVSYHKKFINNYVNMPYIMVVAIFMLAILTLNIVYCNQRCEQP